MIPVEGSMPDLSIKLQPANSQRSSGAKPRERPTLARCILDLLDEIAHLKAVGLGGAHNSLTCRLCRLSMKAEGER